MPKPNHRENIVRAGLAVFHAQGFHGSGVQDVVNHAGVPKGSFYNHFESKNALGLEILNYYWEQHAATRAILAEQTIAPLVRIDRHLAALGYNECGCLVGNFSAELSGSDDFRLQLAELFRKWELDLAACIKDGQRAGSIRDDDSPKTLAEFVIVSLEGAILKSKVDRDPAVLKRFRKSIQKFLKHPS
ncbi:MAG: TetR family transcriptional regulator C-terminal domain-containing protein [Hyphomicrobiaceae bacterium]